MSIEDNNLSKIEQQQLEQKEIEKPKTGEEALDIVKAQKEGKDDTQNLETSTERAKTGQEALDIVKAQKEGKDDTQNLETSTERAKTGQEALDIVKAQKEGKESLEKGININNSDWKNVDKSELKAIDQPKGQFNISKDEKGRVTCVEGWLKKTDEPRSNEEKGFQKELQEKAPKDNEGKALYNSSHIVPHELGGKGEDNLVLMPERINKSFVRSIEQDLNTQLETAPTDQGCYVKASLDWGESDTIPDKIRYEAFVQNSDNSLQKVHDSMTKIDRPSNEINQTLAQILKEGEIEQNTKQWSSQERPKNILLH
ncbi:MAG: DNA/RNA non-specific endonuclease [Snowella sp.]|nr:DNA/RNA non-specific endonuclease [Snowella sp.]